MKIFSVLILSIALLAGCSSSDKKEASPEQQAVTNSDTTKVTAYSDSQAANQVTITTQKLSDQTDTSGLILKTGQLNYTGNEPFTAPALFVDGNETYKLAADSTFMNETFKTLNGKQVSIYGKIREMGTSKILEVHYYKLSENK